jgi:translation initiation factor IF-3
MSNIPSNNRKGGNGNKNLVAPKLRKNDRIRVAEVRVIGPDGKQIGVIQTRDALELAKKYGLDLVEVSPATRPPVCRILDFGKFMYEQSKKTKENKSTSTKLKEIKFRVRIDQHDYMTKIKQAEAFLGKGNKLKLSLMFRGREMEYKELGFETVKRAVADLTHIGTPDVEPRIVGRNINVTMSPLAATKRKFKYNTPAEAESQSDPDDADDSDDSDESDE